MKLNSIGLLAAITMLNVTPTVVFAQNSGNDAGPAASNSDKGAAPSMGTSGEPTDQANSEMLPLHQQETNSATGAQDKGSAMGNDTGNADSNSGSKDVSSSH